MVENKNVLLNSALKRYVVYLIGAGLYLLFLIFFLLFSFWFAEEVIYYQEIGRYVIEFGKTPYLDFMFEYTPGILFYFLLIFSVSHYFFFGVYVVLNWLWCFWMVLVNFPSQIKKAMTFVLLFTHAPYIFFRHDLLPAILSFVSFKNLIKRNYFWAGILVGLGIAVKVYPIFLLPLFIIFIATIYRTNWVKKICTYGAGVFFGSLVPFIGLFFIGGKGAVIQSAQTIFTYHTARGFQIESTWGALFLLFQKRILPFIQFNYGSNNVNGDFNTFALLATVLEIAVLMGIYLFFVLHLRKVSQNGEGKGQESRLLAGYIIITLTAVLIFNKVFSPQYLSWLLFFVMEWEQTSPQKISKAWYTYFTICALTLVIILLYPLLLSGYRWAFLLVTIRNGILIMYLFQMIRNVANLKVILTRKEL